MTYHFRWTCSYLGAVDYEITDETGTYGAEVQWTVSDYALSIANGDDCRRDLLASVGILRRSHSTAAEHAEWQRDPSAARLYQVSQATVDAFNAWRAAEHARCIAHLDRQPERYGVIAADDPLRTHPQLASAGYYVCGQGWTRIDALRISQAA